MDRIFERCADGKTIYRDDFSSQESEAWSSDEEEAYYSVFQERVPGVYAYHARNWHQGFRHLPSRMSFDHVLCLGGTHGDELRPILGRTKKVTILGSAGQFRRPEFEYVKPDTSGHMSFASNSFDLITCFGALHCSRSVTTVVTEIARCTKPLGWQLICEPVHSVGNWDSSRRLLTPRERGIPAAILRKIVTDAGLQIVRQRRCMFSLMPSLQFLLPNKHLVFNTNWIAALDDYLSNMQLWSKRYHPVSFFQKLRPWALFLVLRKRSQ